MSEKRKEAWYDVYARLAGLLADFGSDNPSPGVSLLNLALKDRQLLERNQWIDRNLRQTSGIGIDPIQVFTSFSRPKQNEKSRVDRINSYFKVLAKDGFKPYSPGQIDFSGCPTPLGIRLAVFRLPPQQEEIWKVFLQIMREGQAGLTSEVFDQVKGWFGINIPSFTIFLFWINSSNFLPLDTYTASYVESNKKSTSSVYSFRGYKELLVEPNTAVYRYLALGARSLEKLGAAEIEAIRRYFGVKPSGSLASFPHGCELLGVRPRPGCVPAMIKVLHRGELFWFNEAYQLQNDGKIKYYPDKDTRLYKQEDLYLEATAVVGKNGAGKSTLIELLLAVLNNIACKKWEAGEFKSEGDFPPEEVPHLEVEVYIKTLTVCKIEVDRKKITITEYRQKGNLFSGGRKRDIRDFPVSGLFYTILINYSLYALNEREGKPWLKALFRKNDAYQLPIVLDPYREEGDVEVNIQTRLAKSRLLANLLEPRAEAALDQHHGEWNFRKLTDFQEAVSLRLSLIKEKVEFVYKKKKLQDIKGHLQIVRWVDEIFQVNKNLEGQIGRETMEGRALTYIVRKMFAMAETYPAYKDFRVGNRLKNVQKFLEDIKADPSHMAFKIKQAINYLKYSHLKKAEDFTEGIDALVKRMEAEKMKDSTLQTMHLVPPSFFSVDIELKTVDENGLIRSKEKPSLFSELSSGEKQQIYSINSIIYHLRNIHSLFDHPDQTIVRYPYILLVCDEIELYFHPELQRKFLSTLIKMVASIDLSNIRGINLLFVTHSPFILSDIPRTNTLFLKRKEGGLYATALKRKPDTFGANIHDLLADGFFMSDTIGDFAKEKITEIIEFCRQAEMATDLTKLKEAYEIRKERFNFVAGNIGEGYIKGVLMNHLGQLEELLGEDLFEQRIRRLTDEIKELKKLKNA